MRDDAARLLDRIQRDDTLIAVVDLDPGNPDRVNVDIAYDLSLVEAMAVAAVLTRSIQAQAAGRVDACATCSDIHSRTTLALAALEPHAAPIPAKATLQ